MARVTTISIGVSGGGQSFSRTPADELDLSDSTNVNLTNSSGLGLGALGTMPLGGA